jgi:hypothetical protein
MQMLAAEPAQHVSVALPEVDGAAVLLHDGIEKIERRMVAVELRVDRRDA